MFALLYITQRNILRKRRPILLDWVSYYILPQKRPLRGLPPLFGKFRRTFPRPPSDKRRLTVPPRGAGRYPGPMTRNRFPPTYKTGLSSIPWHHIGVECVCGHSALVPVAPALERLGPDATERDLLDRVRCQRCGARQVTTARIIYAGASADAMKGAPQTDIHLPHPVHLQD